MAARRTMPWSSLSSVGSSTSVAPCSVAAAQGDHCGVGHAQGDVVGPRRRAGRRGRRPVPGRREVVSTSRIDPCPSTQEARSCRPVWAGVGDGGEASRAVEMGRLALLNHSLDVVDAEQGEWVVG